MKWLFCVFSLLLFACTADEQAAPAPATTSSNADIIRNPVAVTTSAEGSIDTVGVARMDFAEPEYLFGEVKEGTLVSHDFTFTNAGSVPLLISDARSTCGCTVPQYPRAPIAPGASGTVRVVFNTANKYGRQRKPVTLTANTYPSLTTVYVDGTILND